MFKCTSCSCAGPKIPYDGLQDRGTLSEKGGMLFTSAISELVKAVKKAASAINTIVLKIEDNKAVQQAAFKVEKFVNYFVFTPLKKLVCKAYSLTKTVGKKVFTEINKIDFSPVFKRVDQIFRFAATNVRSVIKALNDWVFTPLFKMCKKVFEIIKPHIIALAKALTPATKKAVTIAKPHVIHAGKSINDWVFTPIYKRALKPLFTQLGDFFHGVYRGAVVKNECSETYLQTTLNTSLQALNTAWDGQMDSEDDLKDLLESINDDGSADYCIALNSLMALYLKKNHNFVIDQKWIQRTYVSRRLIRFVNNKTQNDEIKHLLS